MNYQEANEYLGKKLQRPIGTGRATRLVRNSGVPGDAIHLKLHDTYIITWYANGRTLLDSGGWRTVTTKARINEFLSGHWRITQRKFEWFLEFSSIGGTVSRVVEFEDGVVIDENEEIVKH